jgi:hypothetical protein
MDGGEVRRSKMKRRRRPVAAPASIKPSKHTIPFILAISFFLYDYDRDINVVYLTPNMKQPAYSSSLLALRWIEAHPGDTLASFSTKIFH